MHPLDTMPCWRFYERFHDDTLIAILSNGKNQIVRQFDMNNPVINNFIEMVIKPVLEEYKEYR